MRFHKIVHRSYDKGHDTFRHFHKFVHRSYDKDHDTFRHCLAYCWPFSFMRNSPSRREEFMFRVPFIQAETSKEIAMAKRLLVAMVVAVITRGSRADHNVSFDKNYHVTWGNSHVTSVNQGTEVHLRMDKASGAGFESNVGYASGFFQIKIKLLNKDFSGVVVAFYVHGKGGNHDELDFEFLGNNGPPFTLQTNVFANDGGREQRFHLWFDPTSDFHTYGIVWNQHQVVFYVDKTPIRVFKNNTKIGGLVSSAANSRTVLAKINATFPTQAVVEWG
ncbi:hypothetical protein J1N35_021306 [Gossypium stocksii]|uniref:GH16 domain-containing protein n=1 Tax=Gossypium stocksii TaxID=47602 RepID=A0A9D3VE06_9ROSI|nr:hypothetical protein J1N35_021306 [Gossypium stocksii]